MEISSSRFFIPKTSQFFGPDGDRHCCPRNRSSFPSGCEAQMEYFAGFWCAALRNVPRMAQSRGGTVSTSTLKSNIEPSRACCARKKISRDPGRVAGLAEMAASIAHELNQPLTALWPHASACRRWMLAGAGKHAKRASAAADKVVQETTRAAEVVRRVRSLFSKSDYVRIPTNINLLIEEFARLLRDDSIRRGVSLKLSLAEGLPLLPIDPIQIQQVF